MARSGDFGWAASRIWARGKCLETLKKVNLGRKWVQMEDEGNPPVKVAGGLGRPFGGSGLAKFQFKN